MCPYTECTSQCESASRYSLPRQLRCLRPICRVQSLTWKPVKSRHAPEDNQGAEHPDCETERISVLFVCLGVDAGCIAASQCIDNQCGENLTSTASIHVPANTSKAKPSQPQHDFFGCADVNCGDANGRRATSRMCGSNLLRARRDL